MSLRSLGFSRAIHAAGRYQWRLDVADDTLTASFQVIGG
jgi:hypothetical protein